MRINVNIKDIKEIVEKTFPNYNGKKAIIEIIEKYSISSVDLNWSGGSKTEVVILKYENDNWRIIELTNISPWKYQEWTGIIPINVMIVEHKYFCGTDMGIFCYINPASQFLPQKFIMDYVQISDEERFVLEVHRSYISSYRNEEYRRKWGSNFEEKLTTIKTQLVNKKLLNINSKGSTSITISGKNAINKP